MLLTRNSLLYLSRQSLICNLAFKVNFFYSRYLRLSYSITWRLYHCPVEQFLELLIIFNSRYLEKQILGESLSIFFHLKLIKQVACLKHKKCFVDTQFADTWQVQQVHTDFYSIETQIEMKRFRHLRFVLCFSIEIICSCFCQLSSRFDLLEWTVATQLSIAPEEAGAASGPNTTMEPSGRF